MPAEKLFLRYQRDLAVEHQWWINGQQYSRTCEAWLARLDEQQSAVQKTLAASNRTEPPKVLMQRWRMFFMACAELFRYNDGEEWGVGHYLFRPHQRSSQAS
jgi:cyclopropane-fatty-acyl-phospholipid synthase